MTHQLTGPDVLALRMASLLLREHPDGVPFSPGSGPGDVAGVVSWLGAMQAQDLASGLWSLGARLPGLTVAEVTDALERREALRTWPMRGTIHLVPGRDARWMVELMGSRTLAGTVPRRAELGLTTADADRGTTALAQALAGGGRLTRAECFEVLSRAGLATTGQRGYHLLVYASLRAVTCLAPNLGKEQSFVLLEEWVPDQNQPDREEALATMAVRYFRSHGPTTRQDFAGWTGLTLADATVGIAAAGELLAVAEFDGKPVYLDPALLDAPRVAAVDEVVALPGFDEYLLGYKDRTLMVDPANLQAIVPGGNGVFQSTIVHGGRAIGTWKRTIGARRVDVDVRPFARLATGDRRRVEASLQPYARFLGLPIEVRWPG